jgi:hypothetical protein
VSTNLVTTRIRVWTAGPLSSGGHILWITSSVTARNVWSLKILLLRVRLALRSTTHPCTKSGQPSGGHQGQQSLLLASSRGGHDSQLTRCLQHGGDLIKSKEKIREEQTYLHSRVKEGLGVPLSAEVIEIITLKAGYNYQELKVNSLNTYLVISILRHHGKIILGIILKRVEVKIGSNKKVTGLTTSCVSSRGSSFTSSS